MGACLEHTCEKFYVPLYQAGGAQEETLLLLLQGQKWLLIDFEMPKERAGICLNVVFRGRSLPPRPLAADQAVVFCIRAPTEKDAVNPMEFCNPRFALELI